MIRGSTPGEVQGGGEGGNNESGILKSRAIRWLYDPRRWIIDTDATDDARLSVSVTFGFGIRSGTFHGITISGSLHLPCRMTADSACRPRPPRGPKELKTSVALRPNVCTAFSPSRTPPFSETTRKFIMGPHVRFATFHGKWKSVNAVALELDISAWLPAFSIRIISRIFSSLKISILNFS